MLRWTPPKKGFYSILIVIYVRRMFVQYVCSRIATVLTAHTYQHQLRHGKVSERRWLQMRCIDKNRRHYNDNNNRYSLSLSLTLYLNRMMVGGARTNCMFHVKHIENRV